MRHSDGIEGRGLALAMITGVEGYNVMISVMQWAQICRHDTLAEPKLLCILSRQCLFPRAAG